MAPETALGGFRQPCLFAHKPQKRSALGNSSAGGSENGFPRILHNWGVGRNQQCWLSGASCQGLSKGGGLGRIGGWQEQDVWILEGLRRRVEVGCSGTRICQPVFVMAMGNGSDGDNGDGGDGFFGRFKDVLGGFGGKKGPENEDLSEEEEEEEKPVVDGDGKNTVSEESKAMAQKIRAKVPPKNPMDQFAGTMNSLYQTSAAGVAKLVIAAAGKSVEDVIQTKDAVVLDEVKDPEADVDPDTTKSGAKEVIKNEADPSISEITKEHDNVEQKGSVGNLTEDLVDTLDVDVPQPNLQTGDVWAKNGETEVQPLQFFLDELKDDLPQSMPLKIQKDVWSTSSPGGNPGEENGNSEDHSKQVQETPLDANIDVVDSLKPDENPSSAGNGSDTNASDSLENAQDVGEAFEDSDESTTDDQGDSGGEEVIKDETDSHEAVPDFESGSQIDEGLTPNITDTPNTSPDAQATDQQDSIDVNGETPQNNEDTDDNLSADTTNGDDRNTDKKSFSVANVKRPLPQDKDSKPVKVVRPDNLGLTIEQMNSVRQRAGKARGLDSIKSFAKQGTGVGGGATQDNQFADLPLLKKDTKPAQAAKTGSKFMTHVEQMQGVGSMWWGRFGYGGGDDGKKPGNGWGGDDDPDDSSGGGWWLQVWSSKSTCDMPNGYSRRPPYVAH